MDFYYGMAQIVGVHTLLGLSAYIVLLTGQVSLAQAGFFAIGAYAAAMLTVLAGWHLVPALGVGALSPLLTVPLTVKGLIVTVIGGLGSIPGAIVAGLLVGGFENAFQLLRGVTERDLYVMLLLFAFLIFRPGGLFAAKGGTD